MVRVRLDEELYGAVMRRAEGTNVTNVARTALRVHLAVLAVLDEERESRA